MRLSTPCQSAVANLYWELVLSSPCVPGLEAGVILVHHNLRGSGRSYVQSQQALERSKTRQHVSAHLCGFRP